jgi:hypothetical protein
MKLIEIRTYRLKRGCSEKFEAAFEEGLVVLKGGGMDVVAFGRSDHEQESYYLIRCFDGREHLEQQQSVFYSSSVWRDGPRTAIVDCIDDYLNTLLWVSPQSVDDLRRSNRSGLLSGKS